MHNQVHTTQSVRTYRMFIGYASTHRHKLLDPDPHRWGWLTRKGNWPVSASFRRWLDYFMSSETAWRTSPALETLGHETLGHDARTRRNFARSTRRRSVTMVNTVHDDVSTVGNVQLKPQGVSFVLRQTAWKGEERTTLWNCRTIVDDDQRSLAYLCNGLCRLWHCMGKMQNFMLSNKISAIWDLE